MGHLRRCSRLCWLLSPMLSPLLASALANAQGDAPRNPLAHGGAAASAADPFARAFRGDGIAIVFARADGADVDAEDADDADDADASAGADVAGAPAPAYRGTLEHGGQHYPVAARREAYGDGEALAGTFSAGGGEYAFTAVLRGDELTLDSDGTTYALRAEPTREPNPLAGADADAGAPPAPESAPAARGQRWQHPRGYFACDLPAGWSVANATDEAVLINPGLGETDTLDAIIAIAFGALDEEERGLAAATLLDRYEPRLRNELAGQGIALQPAARRARPVALGDRVGAEQTWRGSANDGAVTVWLGGVTARHEYLVVTAIVVSGQEDRFLPGARLVFGSVSAPTPRARAGAAGGGTGAAGGLLAGATFAGGETLSGGSLHSIYEFAGGGRVKKEMLMSGGVGILGEVGADTEDWGTYEVAGDVITLSFADGEESASLVIEGGEVTGLRFGRALYRRR